MSYYYRPTAQHVEFPPPRSAAIRRSRIHSPIDTRPIASQFAHVSVSLNSDFFSFIHANTRAMAVEMREIRGGITGARSTSRYGHRGPDTGESHLASRSIRSALPVVVGLFPLSACAHTMPSFVAELSFPFRSMDAVQSLQLRAMQSSTSYPARGAAPSIFGTCFGTLSFATSPFCESVVYADVTSRESDGDGKRQKKARTNA